MKQRAIKIIPAENTLLKCIKSHYPQSKCGFDCIQFCVCVCVCVCECGGVPVNKYCTRERLFQQLSSYLSFDLE